MIAALREWKETILGKKLPDVDGVFLLANTLLDKAAEQAIVAEKFQSQIQQIIAAGNKDLLQQRVNKAILYFAKSLAEEFILPLQDHISSLRFASKLTKYVKELRTTEAVILHQLDKLNSIAYSDLVFVQYEAPAIKTQSEAPVTKTKKEKQIKGASHRDTLLLYREGKSVAEIAQIRNLAVTTIEGHLASFIYSGDIQLDDLVHPTKSKVILSVINDIGMTATSIKQKLSGDYTYGEIRAVMNYYRLHEEQKKQPV